MKVDFIQISPKKRFHRGGKREGAGRPVGSKSKPSQWKVYGGNSQKNINTSPLDYMLGVLNNPMSSPDT